MSEIIENIDWAVNTINSRLMFGMEDAPLQAAYSREGRAKGTLIECKQEIKNLRKLLFEIKDHCPHCGTTEFLCGHGGNGCEKEKE